VSYLNGPRLIFSGRFQADVSTVNNDPANYAPQPPRGVRDGAWNPRGTGIFRLLTCAVTAATYADGSPATGDPVLTLSLLDGAPRPPGKLVDLDTEQQGCSQIWGWRVHLGRPGEAPAFAGDFAVAAFSDLWLRARGNVQGDGRFGAFWQSVLTGVTWDDAGSSRFLRELRAASITGMLSIRLNTDGYRDNEEAGDRNNPDFTSGRIVGAIGPAQADEPRCFVRGRQCAPTPAAAGSVGWFPSLVDEKRGRLIVDFGNAFQTDGVGGPPVALPGLQIGYLTAAGTFSPLSPVPIGDAQWYASTAGIFEVPPSRGLSASEAAALLASPIAAAVSDNAGGWTVYAQEGSDGLHVRADDFVFRMSPGDLQNVSLWADRYGKPLANAQIDIAVDVMGTPQTPASALSAPASVTTGADGRATLALQASDPGRPRQFIDGQVYAVQYGLTAGAQAQFPYKDPFDFVSVLLWSNHAVPETPTWWTDIYPIFLQYSYLYPVMKPIVDLSDYQSVLRHKPGLQLAMSLTPEHSNYMPVTRDLSPAKRTTILNWLAMPNPPEGRRPSPEALDSMNETAKMRAYCKIISQRT
jgi:hypothetical protein